MTLKKIIRHHRLFFVYLILFLLVAVVDLFNFDRILYSAVCELASPISKNNACPTFYDLPIWDVYLSLAILAALYHVHSEIRKSNRHLSRKK
jgi:hypothetical protein